MGSSPDSSTRGGQFDPDMMYLLISIFGCFIRTWMDVFIVMVNCRDWMKKKRLSPTDKILTLQGSIRICLGYVSLIWFCLLKFCSWITQIGYVSDVFQFSFAYFTSCNVWLTATLCGYYCVKIADFSHPFFIHLKQRLSPGLVSTWLFGCAILSFASCLPLAFSDLERQGYEEFSDFFQNKNVTGYTMLVLYVQHVLLGVGYLAAFGICATSAVLLLFSLWRHRQRMLGSWGSHRSLQINVHFQAVITILSLLVVHVFVFVSVQITLSQKSEGNWIVAFGASVGLWICFSVESLISIWGNKKLKNELRRCLYFAKCRGCVS